VVLSSRVQRLSKARDGRLGLPTAAPLSDRPSLPTGARAQAQIALLCVWHAAAPLNDKLTREARGSSSPRGRPFDTTSLAVIANRFIGPSKSVLCLGLLSLMWTDSPLCPAPSRPDTFAGALNVLPEMMPMNILVFAQVAARRKTPLRGSYMKLTLEYLSFDCPHSNT